jgi:16S rRNA (guanine527-N7)-methyltransferase
MLREYLKQINIEPTEAIITSFETFLNLLIEWNEKVNLTAITDPKEIEIKHFIDSLTILKTGKISKNSKIIDVGCGAGFPSFPIKIALPSCDMTLLDSLNKRVIFQNEVIKELGMQKITTIHSRGEDAGQREEYREKFDIATARAVANLSSLVEICVPFLKVGGYFIALKGSDIEKELHSSKNALEKLNAKVEEVISLTLPDCDHKRNIIVIKKIAKTDKKFPRSSPKPIKQPL